MNFVLTSWLCCIWPNLFWLSSLNAEQTNKNKKQYMHWLCHKMSNVLYVDWIWREIHNKCIVCGLNLERNTQQMYLINKHYKTWPPTYIYILYCKTLFILFIYLDWGCIYKVNFYVIKFMIISTSKLFETWI